MSLQRISNPLEELERVRQDLDRVFGRSGLRAEAQSGRFTPQVDLRERDDEFELDFDLPGMEREEVEVEVTDHSLTVRGERSEERDEERENVRFRERSYGRFERSFTLPENINRDQVEAKFENGVLKVRLPKQMKTEAKKVAIG